MTLDHPIILERRDWRSALALLIVRIPLGWMFLAAGWMKFTAIGISNFVNSSTNSIPSYLPMSLGRAYLHALPFVEVISGALILLGLFSRTTATIQSLVLISIMLAVTGYRQQGGMPHMNVALLSVAIALVLLGPGRWSLDGVLFSSRRSTASHAPSEPTQTNVNRVAP